MGSVEVTRPSLSKINSETNLAVQLLLSVSKQQPSKSSSFIPSTSPATSATSSSSSSLCESTQKVNDTTNKGGNQSCAQNSKPFLQEDNSHDQSVQSTPTAELSPPEQQPCASTGDSGAATNSSTTFNGGFKYSKEERLMALNRFREKKRRRHFQKRVRYHVRKRLAMCRPRYKGRFARPPAADSEKPEQQQQQQCTAVSQPETQSEVNNDKEEGGNQDVDMDKTENSNECSDDNTTTMTSTVTSASNTPKTSSSNLIQKDSSYNKKEST